MLVQSDCRGYKYEINDGRVSIVKRTRGFEVVKGGPADTKLPERANNNDAGYDAFAPSDMVLPSGLSKVIWLNVKVYLQDDEYVKVENRSSMMSKHDIALFCSGIIDAGYYSNPNNDGNIGIRFMNYGEPYEIKKGDRICQLIFHKYEIADEDNANGERIGGFGSTGR